MKTVKYAIVSMIITVFMTNCTPEKEIIKPSSRALFSFQSLIIINLSNVSPAKMRE